MKKQILTMAVLAGATMMTSCSKENPEPIVNDRAVQFAGDLDAIIVENGSDTRVTDGKWDSGDTIGIFMFNKIKDLNSHVSYNSVISNNIPYKRENSSKALFYPPKDGTIYYPIGGDSVNFIAYYPYNESNLIEPQTEGTGKDDGTDAKNLITISVNEDQSTSTLQKGSDFLWSRINNNGVGYSYNYNDAVRFNFAHKLSLLVMNIKLDETLKSYDLRVKIENTIVSAPFDLNTGKIIYPESDSDPLPAKDIIPRKLLKKPDSSFYNSYDAIIFPTSTTTTPADNRQVLFEMVNKSTPDADPTYIFTWELSKIKFISGYKYIYDLTIVHTGVQVRGEIEKWKNTSNENGIETVY